MPTISEIIDLAKGYLPDEDFTPLQKAYDYAAEIHAGKIHLSGKPYISHLLTVAYILVSMKLDLQTVVAGLLHGVLKEGSSSSEEELRRLFGKDVAAIVHGTTRITRVQSNNKLTYQAENVRKLLLAMAEDIRVILVKLADCLHDMRSLAGYGRNRQQELARETMELYAPLASRLGIDWMKRELEDLAFKSLFPDEFDEINRKIEITTSEGQSYVEEVLDILRAKLGENNLTNFQIIGRPKHLYSIYKKIISQKIPVEKVYDKVAFRITVGTIKECYEVLGTIHANWAPVPGRIKDFISTPKSNNYQSLHTTVVGPHNIFMEVQIRTEDMDKVAQEGIAAHWAYKEGKAITRKDAKLFKGLKQLIQNLQELNDPKEFLDSVKGELYEPDVYALTPGGEVKGFPKGSTPLDFAYSIHTEVGNHCIGAKVNGRIVPLKHQLENGDLVEIITSVKQRPRRGWLAIVSTSRAKARIRQWLRREEQERCINAGREICERELRNHDLTLKRIIKTGHIKIILKRFGCSSLDDLLNKVGAGKISTKALLKELLPPEIVAEQEAAHEAEIATKARKKIDRKSAAAKGGGEAIRIEGVDNMLVKISRCCLPVPGDEIIGFITTGRGISIHKATCPNLAATDSQRWTEVYWSEQTLTDHQTQIRVVTQDKKGMLAALSNAIALEDANIINLEAHTTPDNLGMINIVVEVRDLDHLRALLQHLRQLDGVFEAMRI